jgi:hypothetical protein
MPSQPERPRCFLARFSEEPCDGLLVRCHLLPRSLLRRELAVDKMELARLMWDERIFVAACGGLMGNTGHHGAFDTARTLKVPRWAIPAGLEEFAAEHRLGWWLDREYGERAA